MSQGDYTAVNLPTDGTIIEASDVTTDLVGLINEFNEDIGNAKFDAADPLASTKISWSSAAFTPTWTTPGTAPSLGNGTITGQYFRMDNFFFATILLTPGSSTTFGTNSFRFSLPFNTTATTGGIWNAVQNAGAATYCGAVARATADTMECHAPTGTYATISSTAPFTWSSDDTLQLTITGEVD